MQSAKEHFLYIYFAEIEKAILLICYDTTIFAYIWKRHYPSTIYDV